MGLELVKLRLGKDKGASQPFSRSGHSTDPQHAKIVEALAKALRNIGFELDSIDSSVSADLVARRGMQTVLFEIKPDNSPCAFYGAIGQLLVYNRTLKVTRCFVVAPGYPESNADIFEQVLREMGAELIEVQLQNRDYVFPNLDKALV